MPAITTTPCAIDMVGTINNQIQMIADLQRQVSNLTKELETNWEKSMLFSIQQSLLGRMNKEEAKRQTLHKKTMLQLKAKHDSMLHVSNWKHLIPAATEQDDEKHDWDNLDFGTIDDSRCGLCGCESDNGMWGEDGDLLEDVICDDCDKEWRFNHFRDAYVPRELTHFTLEKQKCTEKERRIKEGEVRILQKLSAWK